jgi:hypothetical protein
MEPWNDVLAIGRPDISLHTGLLLAEDAALKEHLLGQAVPDRNGLPIPVEVYFRYPEGERRNKYPFITIDFLDIEPAYERWTSEWVVPEDYAVFRHPVTNVELSRGMYVPSESPSLPESPVGTGPHIDPYLGMKLTYQVVTHCRSALHDRYLNSKFITEVFPPRPTWIGVDADATWRRCELLDFQQADMAETSESGNKRVFRKIYTISMDAEVAQSRVYEIMKVTRVHVDIYDEANTKREPSNHLHSDPHTVADESFTVVPPPGP